MNSNSKFISLSSFHFSYTREVHHTQHSKSAQTHSILVYSQSCRPSSHTSGQGVFQNTLENLNHQKHQQDHSLEKQQLITLIWAILKPSQKPFMRVARLYDWFKWCPNITWPLQGKIIEYKLYCYCFDVWLISPQYLLCSIRLKLWICNKTSK